MDKKKSFYFIKDRNLKFQLSSFSFFFLSAALDDRFQDSIMHSNSIKLDFFQVVSVENLSQEKFFKKI